MEHKGVSNYTHPIKKFFEQADKFLSLEFTSDF